MPPPDLQDAQILAVTNGVMGSDAQVLGIAAALDREITIVHAKVSGLRGLLAPLLPAAPADVGPGGRLFSPPWPDLLISVGRKATPFAVATRRASGGRTFTMALQHPRTPIDWYDIIWAPTHDRLSGPNVVSTLTSPHRVTPKALAAGGADLRQRLAAGGVRLTGPVVTVLVGGPNGVFPFTAEEAAAFVAKLDELSSSSAPATFLISFSRRTTPEIRAAVGAWAERQSAWVWDEQGANPYLGLLALADAVVVTSDSVNMAGEAASTGKPIYVFTLAGRGPKFAAFHAGLAQTGATRPLAGPFAVWSYPAIDPNAQILARLQQAYGHWRQQWT